MVIHLQDYYGEGNFEKILLDHGWEKVPSCECLFMNRQQRLFLSVYVGDKKKGGQKQNIVPMWKVLMKRVF